ncbi:uncharacterized protein EV154DRAFT_571635 [Mucor mucedo]|uniref:uncharacterized protein n=1 Tax=Mucor mucedo TaxID=29922 RepID=UPI00221FE40F|nr:uncharacterized protein EV154DRAFT_571635 [Mucor mucedo]KAI7867471.1 hypothetical protein EV154DRAFT_571635 [Mucor mucedo]
MAKPKGSKFKKQDGKRKKGEKRPHPRGGGFGFDKTKPLKELLGEPLATKRSPVRSTRMNYDAEEEVHVVSSGSILDEKRHLATFNQLSTVSVTSITAAPVDVLEQEETLDFFFDSTPAETAIEPGISLPVLEDKPTLSNYERKKQKIIQDDSIYLDSDDDDMFLNDDVSSISSSEDVEMLQALSHWGKKDILQFSEPTRGHKMTSDDEDYAILEGATMGDICESDEDFSLDDDEEDNILHEPGMDFDLLENVPESLKNSYRGIMQQEKSRLKKQAKAQRNFNSRKKEKKELPKQNKDNMLDQILHEFIRRDHIQTYKLSNLTYHGRSMVVPKIAKLFQLELSHSDSKKKNIVLRKTSKTCIPLSYKEHLKKTSKHVMKTKPIPSTRKRDGNDSRAMRDNQNHGKLVASDSVPISSSNIGHRMLAAMGWKQGNAIGNNGDGITEPVKVFMRANRRGLGA